MRNRILDVTAHTTFDLLAAEAVGHEFTEASDAVLDVSIPRSQPDHVQLALELDAVGLSELPAHADQVRLSAAEARTLADALETYADRLESGWEPSGRR